MPYLICKVIYKNPPSCFLKPDGAKHQKGNEDILYPKWTKTHYQGGLKEYDRLERARVIHGKKTRVYMPR
nr:N-acetylmuramidase domain-containing protein [Segatella copri]